MNDSRTPEPEYESEPELQSEPAWAAVVSMGLGVFGLVGAEFLPASVLTPMARDLGITEGMAGQAVTATAVTAVLSSLLIAVLTRRLDRRIVLMGFSILLIISNLVVALSPNLPLLLAGRVLLGVALGGFWALSTATVMRLVPEHHVPRALAMVVSGVSAATIFAAPLGSYFGDLWGWRSVFLAAAVLGLVTVIVQFASLPAMPSRSLSRFGTLGELLSRRHIAIALVAALLVFGGHMAMFTYVRPFLESVTNTDVTGISIMLFAFGIASFLGNYLGGWLLQHSMRLTLAATPLVIGALAFTLVGYGGHVETDAAIIALWGLAFGTIPVGWSAWIARAVPDEAETAGGLLVAAINLAITTGAAVGGLIVDATGVGTVFMLSGVVLCLASMTVFAGVRTKFAVRAAV
ncbi:MFS transporter [Pseudochelatococcus lubricantis]|uniref:MFS transporter n=1 Tax=Pseudochelatococcus lubricantis TaxID=1538102 RepID=UPI0035EC7F24